MDAELKLRSGCVAGYLDSARAVLVLVCERHVTEQAIPEHWPNADVLICDFFDRHAACLANGRYEAQRLVATRRL